MSVQQLPHGVVSLLSSSQVINSISSVVKELIENSIDAGATNVDVKLEKYGLDKIEVRDNGYSITQADIRNVCRPNYTSKIYSLDDLEHLQSYGFRGEALNSMCAVSKLSITTKTEADNIASIYTYDSNGTVRCVDPSSHQKGTIIVVTDLFRNVPVRRHIYQNTKKAAEELKKIERIVKLLSVAQPSLRVTIVHNKCLIWHKTPAVNIRQSLMQVYPHVVLKNLVSFVTSFEEDNLRIEMLICKRDCNWSVMCQPVSEAVLFFVNRRPVKDKKVEKVVFEEMTQLFASSLPQNKCPLTLISLELPSHNLDVNLEPDKSRVFFKNHEDILKRIRDSIIEHFYEAPTATKDELINFDPIDNKPTVIVKKRIIADSKSDNEKIGEREPKIARIEDSLASLDNKTVNELPDQVLVEEDIEWDRICDEIISKSSPVVQNGDVYVDSESPVKMTTIERVPICTTVITESQDQTEDTSQLENRENCCKSPEVSLADAKNVSNLSQTQQTTLSQWSRGNLKNVASHESVTPFVVSVTPRRTIESVQRMPTNATKLVNGNKSEKQSTLQFSKVASDIVDRWRGNEQNKRNKLTVKSTNKEHCEMGKRTLLSFVFAKQTVFTDTSIENIERRIEKSRKTCIADAVRLIASFESGKISVCKIKSELVIINVECLRRNVLFHRYLRNSIIPLRKLDQPFELSREIVGDDLWKFLRSISESMNVEESTNSFINDSRLINNGFKIIVGIVADQRSFLVTEVTKDLRFSLVENLIETLRLMISYSDVAHCRTSFTKRMLLEKVDETCEHNSSLSEKDIEMLLQYWTRNMSREEICLSNVKVEIGSHSLDSADRFCTDI